MMRTYTAVVGLALLALVVSLVLPHVQRWRAERRAADLRHAQQTLRSFTDAPSGMSVDRTATACHALGDLCVESADTASRTLEAVTAKLASVGLSLGAPHCASGDLGALPYGGECEASGSMGGAEVWAVAGAHDNPYWSSPTWVAVVVKDPDGVGLVPAQQPAPAFRARSVLPSGWATTACFPANSVPCHGWLVRAHTDDAGGAVAAMARQLVSRGFGVDTLPESGAGDSLCRTPSPTGSPTSTCGFIAFRDAGPGSYSHLSVAVLLRQDGPSVATGRVVVYQ
jgi:hypothetical protein